MTVNPEAPQTDPEPPARPAIGERFAPAGGWPGPRDPEAEAAARRSAMFVVEAPRRRLADLVLSAPAQRQLAALLTKIRHHQVLYVDFGLGEIDPDGGRTAINLYGPPGTGKTFAAEAIAHELGLALLRANYAEVESKFVGETAKNIKAAFQKARETGAVLFFDEADSILGRRLSIVSQSTDHAVNVSRSVMLMELDRFSGVTIFATNLAANYDPAFVRRLLGHVEMGLPDAEARRRLWRYHIPARLPVDLDAAAWERLVAETDGLAGGDILNIVVQAAAMALAREGPTCRITLADFLEGIAACRAARRVIGVRPEG